MVVSDGSPSDGWFRPKYDIRDVVRLSRKQTLARLLHRRLCAKLGHIGLVHCIPDADITPAVSRKACVARVITPQPAKPA